MSNAHTPGPWRAQDGFVFGGFRVADCENEKLDDETIYANAALIARAPELLAENALLRSAHAELVSVLDDLKALLPVARIMHPQDMDELITRVHAARAALAGEK